MIMYNCYKQIKLSKSSTLIFFRPNFVFFKNSKYPNLNSFKPTMPRKARIVKSTPSYLLLQSQLYRLLRCLLRNNSTFCTSLYKKTYTYCTTAETQVSSYPCYFTVMKLLNCCYILSRFTNSLHPLVIVRDFSLHYDGNLTFHKQISRKWNKIHDISHTRGKKAWFHFCFTSTILWILILVLPIYTDVCSIDTFPSHVKKITGMLLGWDSNPRPLQF